MTPYQHEQLEILRRIATNWIAATERGHKLALSDWQPGNTVSGKYVDLFQHILDELERLECRIP